MTFADYVITVVVAILCFSMLYPFVNLIFQSISPDWVITEAKGMVLYPKGITLENYVYVLIAMTICQMMLWRKFSSVGTNEEARNMQVC